MANAERTTSPDGNVTDIADARRQRQATKKTSNRSFNHEKVAAIKAAIANGTYAIDPQRVADKFIEHQSP